jgi:hypothetical protein
MLEVFAPNFEMHHFLDNRQEVGQGANRRKWRDIGGARQAPGGGEDECVFNGRDRHSTLVQLCSEQTVGAPDHTARFRSATVCVQDSTYILAAVHAPQPCGSRSDGPLIVTV